VEACDGIDTDCDGILPPDEADDDGDGWTVCGGDCDDGAFQVHPGANEVCNTEDDDCDGVIPADEVDNDGDYYLACIDCDDDDPTVNPIAPEICDGLDNDCDGVVPADEVDDDGDGYSICGGDCDAVDPAIHPAATEVCNGIDDDCDGVPDDDLPTADWYPDVDGDGFGELGGVPVVDCGPPPDHVSDATDCDDGDPDTYPGAAELCDGLDNDCDGALPADESDGDADGFWACGSPPSGGDCDDGDPAMHPDDLDGDGYSPCGGDCDDGDDQAFPGALELCTGTDSDCDGVVDDDCIDCDLTVPLDFPAIQDAIDAAAAGSTVCVQPGTYYETLWIEDQGLHLLGLDGPGSTVVDAQGTFTVLIVYQDNGVPSTVEGFTFRGGYDDHGAGVGIVDASPVLRDLVIRDCIHEQWGRGGGLYATAGHPTLIDVRFYDNEAMMGGGAMFEHSATLDGVLFEGNEAEWGGGVYSEHNVSITNAVFRDNHASVTPWEGGGALFADGFGVDLDNVVMEGNSAVYTGGAICGSDASIEVRNGVFVDNHALQGGGVYAYDGDTELSNSTFVGNEASQGGAVYIDSGGLLVDNCVIVDNVAQNHGGGIREEGMDGTYRHNDVWGNQPDDYYAAIDPTGVDGNVSVDPQFLDPSGGDPWLWDLHLAVTSPLIDAGRASIFDPDGGPSDVGAYGGPGADGFDRDRDGAHEWWHPGDYDPATDPPAGWDCDDRDASVLPGQGC